MSRSCERARRPLHSRGDASATLAAVELRSNGQPRAAVPTRIWSGLGFLALAFQGALEGLIQGGLGFFVFLLADAALFVFDFEVEEFVL
jgi:hypothetical protein